MKQKSIQTIQALRGIACVAIVLFHLPSEWGGGEGKLFSFSVSDFFLVDRLFFT